MHVAQFLNALAFGPYVEVVESLLPDVLRRVLGEDSLRRVATASRLRQGAPPAWGVAFSLNAYNPRANDTQWPGGTRLAKRFEDSRRNWARGTPTPGFLSKNLIHLIPHMLAA
jgi:hypothetical protein